MRTSKKLVEEIFVNEFSQHGPKLTGPALGGERVRAIGSVGRV